MPTDEKVEFLPCFLESYASLLDKMTTSTTMESTKKAAQEVVIDVKVASAGEVSKPSLWTAEITSTHNEAVEYDEYTVRCDFLSLSSLSLLRSLSSQSEWRSPSSFACFRSLSLPLSLLTSLSPYLSLSLPLSLSPCFQCKIIIYFHTYDTNITSLPLSPYPSLFSRL